MVSLQKLRNKKVLVFGLGISGIATLKSLIKNKSIVSVWDDNKKKIHNKKIHYDPNFHRKQYDYIVTSPGIDLLKHNHKSYFIKNKKKIITDIDIFVSSLNLKRNKIIAITGTNGKSTFAKLLYNIIKLKCKNTYLLGNYGKPVLSHRINTNQNIYVLELSSYQIEQSKYLKTHYAAILNITPDHLERHKTFSKYFSIKCKVFNSLVPNGNGFVFVSKKYEKLLNINLTKFKLKNKIKKINKYLNFTIKNNYLNNENFNSSLNICIEILKKLKISKRIIEKGLSHFKSLPHRQQIVRKIKNIQFVNDSKATNFDSAEFSIKCFKNIFWIVGGLMKQGDHFYLNKIKHKIIKAYIIGKNCDLFEKKIKKNVNCVIAKTLNKAFKLAYRDALQKNIKESVILLSPAAASFDQFKNFQHRGEVFTKLAKEV